MDPCPKNGPHVHATEPLVPNFTRENGQGSSSLINAVPAEREFARVLEHQLPSADLRTTLDERAIDAYSPRSDQSAGLKLVAETACQLAGRDRTQVRLERIAHLFARAEVQVADLEATVGQRLAAGDKEGFALASRALADARRWLLSLAAEHRASCAVGHRQTVIVAHADVHIDGEK